MVVGGGTPKNAKDEANYDEAGVPWITPADLSAYTKSTIGRGRRSLSAVGIGSSSTRRLPKGTVLISSRAPVGYCAVADEEVTTNQGFRSLVLNGDADPFYIRYYVLASKAYLEAHASGTTFKELSGTALGDLVFPIPPLDTQRRIVARIDELFTELADGEAALARARDDLETYRKSLLKAAVTGELTADWRAANPAHETGEQLLQRILTERKARWEAVPKNRGKRYKEPVALGCSGLPELPHGWTWASVDQLTADQLIGLDRGRAQQSNDPTNRVAYVKMNNVTMAGRVVWNDLRYVQASPAEVSRFGLREGDVLFNTRNSLELVGKTGCVQGPPEGAVFNNNLLRFRFGLVVDPEFLVFQMNAMPFRQELERVKRATTSVAAIYVNTLLPLPVAIPPVDEQRAIVRELHTAMDSELAVALSLDASGVRQSILNAAFRGELV